MLSVPAAVAAFALADEFVLDAAPAGTGADDVSHSIETPTV